MDVNKTDIKKTKRGPIIAAGVSIIFLSFMIAVYVLDEKCR